jgi:zinc D-Ala-D-Ala dipeptidase
MLRNVNERLAAYDVELFLYDAYRPITCQHGLWDFFVKKFHADSSTTNTTVIERVQEYVSDPRLFDSEDPRTWPAHVTGAAIDLTLRDLRTKRLLDMGTHFDDMSQPSHSDYFERLLRDGHIAHDDIRLRNRRLLHWAMAEQGFTNYSYEYWHFDFGDQMHIMTLKHLQRGIACAAWYGYVPPPTHRA